MIDDAVDLDEIRGRLAKQAEASEHILGSNSASDASGIQPKELMQLLSGQQNEISGIKDMAESQASRLKLLRSSLAYVEGQGQVEADDPAVQDFLHEVKQKFEKPAD